MHFFRWHGKSVKGHVLALCCVKLLQSDSLQPHWLQHARLLCPQEFSWQEYCNRLPCPPPGNLPNLVIKPASLMSPALAGRFFTTRATWEGHTKLIWLIKAVKTVSLFQLYTSDTGHNIKTDHIFNNLQNIMVLKNK